MKGIKRLCLIMVALFSALIGLSACALFGKSGGKIKLEADMIRGVEEADRYVYSGKPITFPESSFTIVADGRVVSTDYFDFAYEDNVNVGIATIIVTAKENNPSVKGSAKIHFHIVSDPIASFEGTSLSELNALLVDPNVQSVCVWNAIEVKENERLLVPADKTLYLDKGYPLTVYGELINHGVVIAAPAHLSTGEERETYILNKGSIVSDGVFTVKKGAVLNHFGNIESENPIEIEGVCFLLDDVSDCVSSSGEGVLYVRAPLQAEDVSVSEEGRTCLKGGKSYAPSVSLKGVHKQTFSTVYENNEGAGEALVTIKADERNPLYYGEITVPFTIYKGSADAKDFEELISLSESGNFASYSMRTLAVPSGRDFLLKEDETLSIDGSLSVGSHFANRGRIACRAFTIEKTGLFSNEGSLSIGDGKAEIEGELQCGKTAELVARSLFSLSESGLLRAEGTLAFSFPAYLYGSVFVQEGADVSFEGEARVGASFVNEGKTSFLQSVIFREGADVRNLKSGDILFSDYALFYEINLTNEGRIGNEGDMICRSLGKFSNKTGVFNNEKGWIWTFDPLENVTENVTIRKYLTDESVSFLPEYSEVLYDKSQKKPSFTIDGDIIDPMEYSTSFKYLDREDTKNDFSKVGTIEMTVRIRTDRSRYAGSISFTYRVLHAEKDVSDSYALLSALSDEGWGLVRLQNDLTLPSGKSADVQKTTRLDLNGYQLRIDGKLYNYGEMLSERTLPDPFIPSEGDASLLVDSSGSLVNAGSIESNGLILVRGKGVFRANATIRDMTGNVRNEGLIYTSSPIVFSGSGKAFVRENIHSIASIFSLSEESYTGYELTPTVECTYEGESVDLSRFDFSFSECVDPGRGVVSVSVTDDFDENFYGSATLFFTINRGRIVVSNADALTEAAKNDKWSEIALGSAFQVDEAVAFSSDQTFDLGLFDLTFGKNGKIILGKDCRIVLSAGDKARLLKYVYAADEITLTADINELVQFNFASYDLPSFAGERYLSTLIHMNGCSFLYGVEVYNALIENFEFTFENSSEVESAFGSENSGAYGFEYQVCSEETFVTMRNVTVYGARQKGGYGTAQSVRLTAENCVFKASVNGNGAAAYKNDAIRMSVEGEFTNCTFSGNAAFYARTGEFLFRNCRFDSTGYYVANSNPYVSAVTLNYGGKWGFDVRFIDSILRSFDGNGIEVVNKNNAVSVSIDEATAAQIFCPEEKAKVSGL